MVSFKVTKAELHLIDRIVMRAEDMHNRVSRTSDLEPFDRKSAVMDMCACQANNDPLDLDALYGADDFNFAHDVFGIARHIDRATGKLGDCFVPRFTKRNW